MGEAFACRVAASILNAIGLPELVTTTYVQYEARAVELAVNPEALNQVRQKLGRNRLTAPLFDTPLFTRRLEAAYTQIYERYHSDLPSEHLHVAS
jgi:predicted O-linked N-acetylglucosamine transferase (SPINDLY family)